MKILFAISLLFSGTLCAQNGIYKVALNMPEGKTLTFENFRGKKIFIAAGSISDLQSGGLAFLDSLQTANPKIAVIVIPAVENSDSTDVTTLLDLKNKSGRHVMMSTPARFNRVSKTAQNGFLDWFTGNRQEMHFDPVANSQTRYMVISESGILYAILEKGVLNSTINEVIQQGDIIK